MFTYELYSLLNRIFVIFRTRGQDRTQIGFEVNAHINLTTETAFIMCYFYIRDIKRIK